MMEIEYLLHSKMEKFKFGMILILINIKIDYLELINILENDSSSNNLNNYILEFSDLSIYTADLIIGCDGINSITRKFKYPLNDLPLNYLGILLGN